MAEVKDASTSTAASDSDSEYEYQYAEETEDFYFTLDVTRHQSQAALKPNQSTQNNKSKGKQPAQPTDKLQVLDLHSEHPLIKLGDSFYSCHWSTDLGTQFYVTKPGIVEEPLRRGYVLDVLGISRARLTGNPVTLHHRKSDSAEEPAGSSAVNGIVLDIDDDEVSPRAAPVNMPTAQQYPMSKSISRLTAAHQNARDPLVKAQASFLERLATMKRQKGEADIVPAHGVEELTGPRQDGGIAVTTNRSNGKRNSVSDGIPDGAESGEPSRKCRMSDMQIVQDADGDSPSTYGPPNDGNASLLSHQSQDARDDAEGERTSEFHVADDEAAVNSHLEVADGQIMGHLEQTEDHR